MAVSRGSTGCRDRVRLLATEDYASGLASGNLPDIVATDNNLSTILDSSAALNVDPYLEEYVPNFLQGDTRLAYDVFKQLLSEEDGFELVHAVHDAVSQFRGEAEQYDDITMLCFKLNE